MVPRKFFLQKCCCKSYEDDESDDFLDNLELES